MANAIINYFKSFTIEPVILFFIFGGSILNGAQIQTDLIIRKICMVQLNYTQDICSNLSAEENEQEEIQVQKSLQGFELKLRWIESVPTFLYTLYMGALSDKFGRKPLIFLPLLGAVIDSILNFVNYRFIDTLSLDFFYVMVFLYLLGGMPTYFLGVYSFGSQVSNPKERASRLTRMDGMEVISMIIATSLSAHVFKAFGHYGTYTVTFLSNLSAFLYLVLIVKEPMEKQEFTAPKFNAKSLLWTICEPVYSLGKSLFKKRPNGLRNLVLLQIFVYSIYWFIAEDVHMRYPYLLYTYPGFTGQDFSYFQIFIGLRDIPALLILMPLMNIKLKWHESMIATIACIFSCFGFIGAVFATQLWQYYVSHLGRTLMFCVFGGARSMVTKCIDDDEVGKVFSAMSILGALVPFASNPIFRKTYTATIETFPGAYMLICAGACLLAAILNFYLFTQRHRMRDSSNEEAQETHQQELQEFD